MIKAHAMSRSASVDPLQKFKYRVTIAGLPAGIGFSKVSGLSQEIDVAEYDEGMYDHTHKLPGKSKVQPIVCERGAFADDVMRGLLMTTLSDPSARNTVLIEHLDRFGNVIRVYRLAECWASKWEGDDFDSKSSEVYIEKLTLQFEYFI